ncbi:MAG: monovalent cation/H(+) antiporter subunit G [Spirochaetia bacterium]|jgi:multicomponent Na+:H+ antiporter subunit G|nr:monovalent cation/H(+) antiporter subunit G [Spirochaetia bacterium]
MEILPIVGGIVSLMGALFLLLGAVGVLRMPDSYNRIQAGTKATTLGTLLFLLGIGIYNPVWFPKLVVLILFILFTNPVSSHVLARSAHSIGIKLTEVTVVDKLKDTRGEEIDA